MYLKNTNSEFISFCFLLLFNDAKARISLKVIKKERKFSKENKLNVPKKGMTGLRLTNYDIKKK